MKACLALVLFASFYSFGAFAGLRIDREPIRVQVTSVDGFPIECAQIQVEMTATHYLGPACGWSNPYFPLPHCANQYERHLGLLAGKERYAWLWTDASGGAVVPAVKIHTRNPAKYDPYLSVSYVDQMTACNLVARGNKQINQAPDSIFCRSRLTRDQYYAWHQVDLERCLKARGQTGRY